MIDPILDIDLGTTNSVVAVADEHGRVEVIPDEDGRSIHPSIVAFHPNGTVLAGAVAKKRRLIDPPNTIYSAKRLIGQTYEFADMVAAVSRVPYRIIEGDNQQPLVETRAGNFAIPELSAILLDHLRKLAERHLGVELNRAVVTVPANFTDAQRTATTTAGAIAGIEIPRIINEPTAAALAYGQGQQLNETVAVYDLGGGTFDITIIKLASQVYEVLGTAGDSFLGGDDIDERLVDTMVELFLQREHIDLRGDDNAVQRLRTVAERLKVALSKRSSAPVKIERIAYGEGGKPLDLNLEMSRDELIAHTAEVVDRTFPVCDEALRIAKLSPTDVNHVVLVGGSTKMPYIRRRVAEYFQKEPRPGINPDEAVAIGAALQGLAMRRVLGPSRKSRERDSATASGEITAQAPAKETHQQILLIDLPRPGTAGKPGAPLLPDSPRKPPARPAAPASETTSETTIDLSAAAVNSIELDLESPTSHHTATSAGPDERTFVGRLPPAPAAEKPKNSIELDLSQIDLPPVPQLAPTPEPTPPPPDERANSAQAPDVPIPPSIEALFSEPLPPPSQSSRDPSVPAVLDVLPHSLGVGTVAGYCEELIGRNTRVPTETKKIFATSKDQQESVRIVVCQGESRLIDENVILGDLVLEGLQQRLRGETSIEVTFRIDASGILRVRARDLKTGLEQRANLVILGAQSNEEIEAAAHRLQQIRS